MRTTVLAMTAAAAILSAGALCDRATAMTLTIPEAARSALDTISQVDKAVCWRYGWNGWGCYRWCPCYATEYGWCSGSHWYRDRSPRTYCSPYWSTF